MPIAPYPTFGAPVPGAGGVQPYEHSGPGGFVRVRGGVATPGGVVPHGWQGGVRILGVPTPAKPATPRAAAASPAFPPTGTFDPSREIETTAGQHGLEQLEAQGNTDQARWRTDYGVGMGEYDRQTREQNEGLQKALGLLKESFTKLGTRQEEGANKAGLLSGGALLQAAAKRGANEGKEATVKTEARDRATQAIDRARAKFIQEWAPPDAGNALGGRHWQDLGTQLRNARENQVNYALGQQTEAGAEAARLGYVPPESAVASSRAQPAHAQRYLNRRTGRMETFRNGRWGG